VCGPPKNADGTLMTFAGNDARNNNAISVANWFIDPTNPNNIMSCDILPGSSQTTLIQNFVYPTTSTPYSYNLIDTNENPYTSAINKPIKCVKWDDALCSSYNTTPGQYKINGNMCVDSTLNIDRDNYAFPSTPGFSPLFPPTGGRITGEYIVYDIVTPKVLQSIQSNNLTTIKNDIRIPKIPSNYISDPTVMPAQCRCLLPNGQIDPTAYFYNKKCIRCATPGDIFYPRGQLAASYTWSPEKPNMWLSLYVASLTYELGPAADQQQTHYNSIRHAQTACEINPNCNGITRTFDSEGKSFYTVRGGKIPMPTGGQATIQGVAYTAANDGTIFTINDSSWLKISAGSGGTVPDGFQGAGTAFSALDIPRAFATDYTNPNGGSALPLQWFSGSSSDVSTAFSNAMLQVASLWSSWQNSVQNTNTYYQLNGITRTMNKSAVPPPSDTGICVGPCDPQHTMHDPIQMVYDFAANGGTGKYHLFGTTCHDATQVETPTPSIPANYTVAKGSPCPPNQAMNANGLCVRVCTADERDTGTDCIPSSLPRAFTLPSFTCPTGMSLADTVCVQPCPSGMVEDSGYCEPIIEKISPPAAIKCTERPYITTTISVSGSSKSLQASKWLCDKYDDADALFAGPARGSTVDTYVGTTQTYVGPNDMVCTTDDPTVGLYYCQSVDDHANAVSDTQPENYKITCDNLTKAYLDLSNNLTILMEAKTTATTSSAQIAAIEVTLRSVIEQTCGSTGSGGSRGSRGSTGSGGSSCTSLWTYLNALNTNIGSGTGGISGILNPIDVAVSSQNSLRAMLTDMKCQEV
jgi:hypothetical protein